MKILKLLCYNCIINDHLFKLLKYYKLLLLYVFTITFLLLSYIKVKTYVFFVTLNCIVVFILLALYHKFSFKDELLYKKYNFP